MSHTLKLELIQKLAEQEKTQLKDDAIRTIRQKDPERGMACLNQIEGIDRFVQTLDRACCSPYWKQLGDIQEIEAEPIPRAPVQPIRRKAGRPAAARQRAS